MNRPTAESIWRSFAISKKKHLFLTGSKGSGKTTLHRKLLTMISEAFVPGITTWVRRSEGVYLRENLTGKERPIGIYDELLQGTENKMRLLPEGFTELGIPALQNGRNHASEWFSIDEIGFLESGCPAYVNALKDLMKEKRLIACVRKQNLPFLTERINRPDVFAIDLDRPYGNLGCVIMASGLGKRFGSNKLMADFGGKPLIERILDTTDGIFANRVVVTRHPEIIDLCRKREITAVFHQLPLRSDTVRLGIEAQKLPITGCLFCPSDQPLLLQETVQAMAISAAHSPDVILQLGIQNQAGAPVLFPKWTFQELAHLPEGKGGNVLLKKYKDQVKTFPAKTPKELMDIDRKEDLERLQKFFI